MASQPLSGTGSFQNIQNIFLVNAEAGRNQHDGLVFVDALTTIGSKQLDDRLVMGIF